MADSRVVTKTIDEPADSLLFDRGFTNALVLRCPVCGDQYSHVQSVHSLTGGDESGGGYKGAEVSGETPYRRDALAVRVQGESCGHKWDVVFQQHKGQTFVRIDILQ
jgi:hypothetical protein